MAKLLRRSATALLVACATLFVSCGGGGGEAGVTDVPEADYFPLEADGRWIYHSSADARATVANVVGTRAVGQEAGTVIETIDGDGVPYRLTYTKSASRVREHAPPDADPMTRAYSDIDVMRLPLRIGDSFVQYDRTVETGQDFDGDGRSDRLVLHGTLTVRGLEAVTTPAGRFPDSVHQRQAVRQTMLLSAGGRVSVDATIDTWYAPGVGPVRQVVRLRGPGIDQTIADELIAYRVGDRRSESEPPALQSTTPGAQPVRGVAATVRAVFSEPLDPASLVPAALTVRDSADVPVAGQWSAAGNTLTFEPAQPWASGSYTARIAAGVTDLIGNRTVDDHVWTFVVDATAPGLVWSSPAAGAKDVEPDTTIVLEFSELPAPATVNGTTIRLTDGYEVVPAVVTLDAKRITIVPARALQRGRTHTVEVNDVTDVPGNPIYLALNFSVTQGWFAYPVSLFPDGEVRATAIGDVNGDGIDDVVMAVTPWNATPVQSGLVVRRGGAHGALAPPVWADTDDLTCSIDTIAIGDLDGDGRADVAVGGNYCGGQVLRQTAAGELVRSQRLARPATGTLRIVDLDGDGWPELVGSGGNTGSIEIWKGDANGSLHVSSTPQTTASLVLDLAVGDVNGDGRPDIVAAVRGNTGEDVDVLLQQPDGSFGTPQNLSTGGVGGARAVAAGDFNGDGRADIAATAGGNTPISIVVYAQQPDGSLGPATHVPTYESPMSVRAADIDGDGRTDIVVSHGGWQAVGIYLQQPDGTLAPERRFEAPYGSWRADSMTVGDVDRDGRLDIVVDGMWIRQRLPATEAVGAMAAAPGTRAVAKVLRPVTSALRDAAARVRAPGAQ